MASWGFLSCVRPAARAKLRVGDSFKVFWLLATAVPDGEMGVRGTCSAERKAVFFSGESFFIAMGTSVIEANPSTGELGVDLVPFPNMGDGCGIANCCTSGGK